LVRLAGGLTPCRRDVESGFSTHGAEIIDMWLALAERPLGSYRAFMHRPRTLRALSVFLLVVLESCRLLEPSRTPHPLAGTWEVTTAIDLFTFETAAPSPPDCPSATLYCPHYRPDTLGRLSFTMNIADVDAADGPISYPVISSTVTGMFCDSYSLAPGCTHAKAVGPLVYPTGDVIGPFGQRVPADSVSGRLHGPADEIIHFEGRVAGDSIVGRLYWAQHVTRWPPAHLGNFVARRR
jgi:hypothetical protein